MRVLVLALAIWLSWPMAASAGERNMSYRYWDIGYSRVDLGDDSTGSGRDIRFSREFGDVVFAFANYRKLTGDARLTTRDLGMGLAFGLGDHADLFVRLGVADSKLNWELERGYMVETGVRYQLARKVEAFGTLRYEDIYEEAENGYEAGFRYWYTDGFAFTLSRIDMGEQSGFNLSARFNF